MTVCEIQTHGAVYGQLLLRHFFGAVNPVSRIIVKMNREYTDRVVEMLQDEADAKPAPKPATKKAAKPAAKKSAKKVAASK